MLSLGIKYFMRALITVREAQRYDMRRMMSALPLASFRLITSRVEYFISTDSILALFYTES